MATIVTKNSSTASAVPTTSDLVQGELAVNVTDKRIFTENASTQIVELGTNPSTVTTATATVTGTLTANGTFASSNAVITGGSINSTPIGATTPSTVRGSTVTATTGFVGGLTGNVTGNLTGNVTGNVTGDLTGNVTGNVTASSGTTTLNDLVVNGTADFTNTKLTNITTPTVGSDAANKSYVDDTVAAVIDSAPAALDTLNELAAALGDDADFAGTVTTALATKLPLAGGTMTGAIAMGTSKITGLGNPTAAQDAATKTYVDTADALKLNLTGGTMSGAIAMGTNKITGVGDPTLAQDAATKAYTDSILGSATSAATSAAAAATSASNAATSASNAASSATASSNSASAAAASYDAFDDRYLGDKTSDPTLDNDGNALLTGALYFNTTSDDMKVYDGSAWNIAAISSASPTFTGTVTADGLSLGDNDKATFGNSNDLQIYHDGSGSYVDDQGTGPLYLRANRIDAVNLSDAAMFTAIGGNAVQLYYNGNEKLATTSTGIDVTGTATMDGLTVDDGSVIVQDATGYATIALKADTSNSGSGGTPELRFELGGTQKARLRVDTSDNVEISTGTGTGTTRFGIASNGDISFYEDTGTTPKFFWDASAEALGIGNSPLYPLHVETAGNSVAFFKSTTTNSNIVFIDGSATANVTVGSVDNGQFRIQLNNAERMRIDSSGNVGIGTTSPSYLLSLEQASPTLQLKTTDTSGTNTILFSDSASAFVGNIKYNHSDNSLSFATTSTPSERMRIDASGNLLVGKTSTSSTTAGTHLNPNGKITTTRSGGPSAAFVRLSSDGSIVDFQKDSTTVGSIGVNNSRPYIASTAMGLKIAGTEIHSTNSSGTSIDNTYDVGSALYRWDDIYATNGTIQTSDANEKQDIESLSEAEQRVAVAAKGLLRKFRWKSSVEEKGDDARIHFGIIAQDLQAAFEAEGLDAGRYAMFIHSTWTDEETGEERSRMGVRYSELLAFIIAAL